MSRKTVYQVAAEVFHRKGYDKTSMSDVAAAAGLTKAGLYHHISSKESLLFIILESGLDLTDSRVVQPLQAIEDPLERLMTMIELHLRLVLEERNLEVTGLLHECRTLSTADRNKINRRKKQYVKMTSDLIGAVSKKYGGNDIHPKLAAFALLGMLNWTYQWYKASGQLRPDDIIQNFQQLFRNALLGKCDAGNEARKWKKSRSSTRH